MRPIPRKLLIHTAIQKYNQVDDGLGHLSGSSRSLSRIRIEPSSKIVITRDNTQKQLTSVLFYDCRNSLPAGVAFTENDVITFNDVDYAVLGIDKLYDNKGLHHYEIGLG